MKDIKKILGKTCKRLREGAGITQEALGEAAGVSGKYISRIEKGKANPTLTTIQKLARGLQVDVAVLADFRELGLSKEQIRENLLREIAEADDRTIMDLYCLSKRVFQ